MAGEKDRRRTARSCRERDSAEHRCAAWIGLFESFHLSFCGFSKVARCGAPPGEDDRLHEENETLIKGATVSIGVRPMPNVLVVLRRLQLQRYSCYIVIHVVASPAISD